jgi:hypothetical protein
VRGEKPQKFVVVFRGVRVKRLNKTGNVLLADNYYDLSTDLEIERYGTTLRCRYFKAFRDGGLTKTF